MKIWIERKIKSKLALASFNSYRGMEARIQEECSQTKQIFHGLGTTHYQGRQFSVELQKRIVSTYLIWLKMKVAQLCLTLCNHMDYTVHGILQARILEWVTVPFSRGSSQPRNRTQVSSIAGRFFTSLATREAQYGLNMVQKRGRWGKTGIDNLRFLQVLQSYRGSLTNESRADTPDTVPPSTTSRQLNQGLTPASLP